MNEILNKICNKCGISKQLDQYYKNKQTKDKLLPTCKICTKLISAIYQKNNPDKTKKYKSKWKNKNKDKVHGYNKKWAIKNPEKRRENKRKWDRKAMLNPMHRLGNNMRRNMHHALKRKKGFRKWEHLSGYTLQDLINHIDIKLINTTMTWENYGTEWHIDHITPKSWFKYTTSEDPLFKQCWALSNLQPKLKLDNIKKGNRFIG